MGIILVYDCTEEVTFNNIENWLKQIDTHASSGVAKILVANKTDLPNRTVTSERGMALAQEHGLNFFETSAKTGANINELFFDIAQKIVKDKPAQSKATGNSRGSAAAYNQGKVQSAEQARVKLG